MKMSLFYITCIILYDSVVVQKDRRLESSITESFSFVMFKDEVFKIIYSLVLKFV